MGNRVLIVLHYQQLVLHNQHWGSVICYKAVHSITKYLTVIYCWRSSLANDTAHLETVFYVVYICVEVVMLTSVLMLISRSCFILFLQKETPLANAAFWAARRGNLALLRLLLNSGRVDVDCRDSVRTDSFGIRMPRTRHVPAGMRAPPEHISLNSAYLLSCVCLLYPFEKVQGTRVNLKMY